MAASVAAAAMAGAAAAAAGVAAAAAAGAAMAEDCVRARWRASVAGKGHDTHHDVNAGARAYQRAPRRRRRIGVRILAVRELGHEERIVDVELKDSCPAPPLVPLTDVQRFRRYVPLKPAW
jgi:hypothetical protein